MNNYSFIIPTYQGKTLIINTLEALNHLIGRDQFSYQVIVVDDGSTDGTGEAINKMSLSYPLKYIYIPRTDDSSRAKARNCGIKQADGEYLIFIDGDILVPPDYLLTLNTFFKWQSDIIVVGTRKLLYEPIPYKKIQLSNLFAPQGLAAYEHGRDFRHLIFEDLSYNASAMDTPFLFALTCNLAVPKNWAERVGGFDENLKKWGIEDIEFVYRLQQEGLRIVINSRNEVIHQFHGLKEKNVVDTTQIQEVDYNAKVFIRKYPYFLGLEKEAIHELFRSIATHYKALEKVSPYPDKIIHFNNQSDYEKIQDEVLRNNERKEYTLVIYDEIGCTDLDIWIQLHTENTVKVKYYPKHKL
nr:glycosyltransferase [uncultured Cellulosilyticum sp.]